MPTFISPLKQPLKMGFDLILSSRHFIFFKPNFKLLAFCHHQLTIFVILHKSEINDYQK